MPEVEIGQVTVFFPDKMLAGVTTTAGLRLGDTLRIKGYDTDLEFTIGAMQVDDVHVAEVQAGNPVAIKVPLRVSPGDRVYKVLP